MKSSTLGCLVVGQRWAEWGNLGGGLNQHQGPGEHNARVLSICPSERATTCGGSSVSLHSSSNSMRTVVLRSGPKGFGFTLGGERPCRLSTVHSGGVAAQAGLQARDRLLAVNGVSVIHWSHAEIASKIAACGTSFSLTVEVRQSDILFATFAALELIVFILIVRQFQSQLLLHRGWAFEKEKRGSF
uniref:PDZ domain-containing protein n=1 Tax=Plectus sambesii TaxID=2011161 RepID=A0A914WBX6_9BILA